MLIEDLGIHNNSTIRVTKKVRGGTLLTINIENEPDRNLYIDMSKAKSIKKLKKKIAKILDEDFYDISIF